MLVAGQIPLAPATMSLLAAPTSVLDASRTTWALVARHAWTILRPMRCGPRHQLLGIVWLAGSLASSTAALEAYRAWWAAAWPAAAGGPTGTPLVVIAAADALPRGADVEVAWLAAGPGGRAGL